VTLTGEEESLEADEPTRIRRSPYEDSVATGAPLPPPKPPPVPMVPQRKERRDVTAPYGIPDRVPKGAVAALPPPVPVAAPAPPEFTWDAEPTPTRPDAVPPPVSPPKRPSVQGQKPLRPSQIGMSAAQPSAAFAPQPALAPASALDLPLPQREMPLLLDVTPHSLGIETVGGFCEHVVRRNATIPVEQSRMFTTSGDGQAEVEVRICQGESRRLAENQELGSIQLAGLRQAARGQLQIEVTFILDADGTLGVRAKDVETGRQQAVRISLVGAIDPAVIAARGRT
jgi:molecular chaperone DnaK